MAVETVRTRDAVAYVGIESTFGSSPSMTRATLIEGTFEPSAEQTEIQVPDERVRLDDLVTPVRGLKGGGCKFSTHVRPSSSQLTAAVTETHYLGVLLKAIFGGESVTGGSTVAAATSTTVIDVGAGHGVRFAAGQTVLVGVSGVLYPVRIKSVATDTLTFAYALPGASAIGQLVVGCYNYHITQTNSQSLTIKHGKVASNSYDWVFNGCTGSASFDTSTDQLIKIAFDLKAATHTGPADASLTKTSAAESMGRPFAMRDYFCLLQPVATTTRTHVEIQSASFELAYAMEHVMELAASGSTGTAEGKVGVARLGEMKPSCKAKLKLRPDTASGAVLDLWTNQTPTQLVVACPQGSGTTKRWAGWDIGTCMPVGKPKHPSGPMETIEAELWSQVDTSTTGSTADVALSSVRFFVG